METVYGYQLSTLGFFTAAFLVGAGAFQIPVGIYAARHGATRAALIGLAILGVTSVLSAASGEFYLQLAMRFLAGMGSAFYFAPGLVIASSVLGQRSGLASGVYSGLFYLGGGVASLAFTPLASSLGWQTPFIVSAVISFVALSENAYAFRGHKESKEWDVAKARHIFSSRTIRLVAISILGASAVNYVITQFFINYVEDYLRYPAAITGTVASLVFIGAAFGGPVGGWLSDHFRNRRRFLLLPSIGAAISVSLFAVNVPVALLLGRSPVGPSSRLRLLMPTPFQGNPESERARSLSRSG
jgi:MFS family permease